MSQSDPISSPTYTPGDVPPINTLPSKVFFVDMLTRDISLVDVILDLVDNAIDKLIARMALNATQAVIAGQHAQLREDAKIIVRFEDDKFTIEDTSGGMRRSDIEERVFVLGNPRSMGDTPGLSVYGIGMKRAFFKIGNQVELLTETEDDGKIAVVWDIGEWKHTAEWRLPFATPDELTIKRTLSNTGTSIQITQLHPEVSTMFSRTSFQNDLRNRLETVYAGFISAGVSLHLQHGKPENPIQSVLPEFGTSSEINVAHTSFLVEDVHIKIYAGVTPSNDRRPHGWYVFCNGRMVLAANKDWTTGWSDNFPGWHPKYNHFLGFVFFESDDLLSLPWPTTKQGVVREAHVYRIALEEMKVIARPIINFFDARFVRNEDNEVAEEREMLKDLAPTSIANMSTGTSFRETRRTVAGPKIVTISYKKTDDEVKRAKSLIGDPEMSHKALGERTFDYFMENEE